MTTFLLWLLFAALLLTAIVVGLLVYLRGMGRPREIGVRYEDEGRK